MQDYRRVDSRGNLVLPKGIREGIDLVEIERRPDGVIELRPQVAIDADQAWFWTERWQKMEREADADIAAGRVKSADNIDALFEILDSDK